MTGFNPVHISKAPDPKPGDEQTCLFCRWLEGHGHDRVRFPFPIFSASVFNSNLQRPPAWFLSLTWHRADEHQAAGAGSANRTLTHEGSCHQFRNPRPPTSVALLIGRGRWLPTWSKEKLCHDSPCRRGHALPSGPVTLSSLTLVVCYVPTRCCSAKAVMLCSGSVTELLHSLDTAQSSHTSGCISWLLVEIPQRFSPSITKWTPTFYV